MNLKNTLNRTVLSIILALSCLTPSLGCTQSPLFNHSNESAIGVLSLGELCSFSFLKSNLCSSLTWTIQPDENNTGEFLLKFWNPKISSGKGPYTNPSPSVFVKLWMPAMGHGSSPVKVIPLTDANGQALPGQFKATGVSFIMSGKWEIHVQLKSGTQVLDQSKIDITI
jgi:hypothetical protein